MRLKVYNEARDAWTQWSPRTPFYERIPDVHILGRVLDSCTQEPDLRQMQIEFSRSIFWNCFTRTQSPTNHRTGWLPAKLICTRTSQLGPSAREPFVRNVSEGNKVYD